LKLQQAIANQNQSPEINLDASSKIRQSVDTDEEIGNRLKSEIKRLLLSDHFQKSGSVEQMTELLM
jgi:hypothetical protein